MCKDKLTDLKLVIDDTIDNVATLQDCNMEQTQSVQLLSERHCLSVMLNQCFTQKISSCITVKSYCNNVIFCEYIVFSPSDIQASRAVHDQITMLELRSMLSEMKELLNQQVTPLLSECVRREKQSMEVIKPLDIQLIVV